MGSEIRICVGCKEHPFQDERYGKNMRVHCIGKGHSVCSVCSAKKDLRR